ncbi:MAG: hypothetical protein PGN26_08045 [Xylophilus ampelinus]
MASQHSWQFFRAGGVDQVVIRTGADIAHLDQLDQKLWVALACPTRGLEFDARTLDLIDTDRDGRIRPPELLDACRWVCAQLRDPEELVRGGDSLDVGAIDDRSDAGAELAGEARRILELLGKDPAGAIRLEDVTDRSRLLAAMLFNGDGVVTPAATDDPELRALVQDIAATFGGVADRNGETGIDRTRARAFFDDANALDAWHARAAADGAMQPFGAGTLAAAEAVAAVRAKVDDFFARCRLADYDIRAVTELNPTAEEYRQIGAGALSLHADAIAALPLAPIQPGRALPLSAGVNPAWARALAELRRTAVEPVLGADADAISEAEWQGLQQRLAACRAWLDARPATAIGALDVDALRRRLAAGAEAAIMALIDQDEAVEPHNARIGDLEKLLRLKRDLLRLLHNFVSFRDFYRREGAIFQAGTLFLDARSCDLTVQVADAAKHAVLAGLAKTCLAYCECSRRGEKMTIAAAFTAGDVDFLFVGRNGIFYDRQGRDWDATITKLIENPISVTQAFFSPYKKFLRVLEEQIAKRAAASETAAQGTLDAVATNLAGAARPAAGATAAAAAPAAPASGLAAIRLPGRVDVGTVAALGVALGSISTVLVGLFGKFVDLGQWIPIAVLGIVLAISGPSMLIAWLKLRQRSLGPILDASGWAINGRMKVNVRLGASLSKTASVPPTASGLLHDPFADRRAPWAAALATAALVAAAVLAWRFGWADRWLPAPLRYPSAPAAAAGAPGAAQKNSMSWCATPDCSRPARTSSS